MLNALREPMVKSPGPAIELQVIGADHLGEVNAVLKAAIAVWDVSPRVKRLALASYQYDEYDLQQLDFLGAWHDGELVGFVSLEFPEYDPSQGKQAAVLVHGLYVTPEMHSVGVGTRLVDAAKQRARDKGHTSLLVRAERNARAFFEKLGFTPLPVEDAQRDYPHRLSAALDGE